MPATKLVVIYPVPTDREKFERLYPFPFDVRPTGVRRL